jgi:hypothetical protein
MTPEDLAKLTELEKAAGPAEDGFCRDGAHAMATFAYYCALNKVGGELLAIAAAHLKLCSALEFLAGHGFECIGDALEPARLIELAADCDWTWPDSARKGGGDG